MFFLSTFTDDGGRVRSYSIDVEKADDSHYEFSPEVMNTLDGHLAMRYAGGSPVELLTQFIASASSTRGAEEALGNGYAPPSRNGAIHFD